MTSLLHFMSTLLIPCDRRRVRELLSGSHLHSSVWRQLRHTRVEALQKLAPKKGNAGFVITYNR
jgi:hypothetical protein